MSASGNVDVSGYASRPQTRPEAIGEMTWLLTVGLASAGLAEQVVDASESWFVGAVLGLLWAQWTWDRHGGA